MRAPLTRSLLVLTFVTGIVDAASFLGLGHVFVAMQTGNVIFAGLGIAGTEGAPLIAPVIAIAAFLAGGAVAVVVGRRLGSGPGVALGPAAALEVALLAFAAVLA